VLRVRVPAAGTVRVRARGSRTIRAARGHASAAGVVNVTVRPSRAGKAKLARQARLRVRALLSFTPVGGATQTARRTLTLLP
jgi:hypothetical protein